jgi:hypothetical protein
MSREVLAPTFGRAAKNLAKNLICALDLFGFAVVIVFTLFGLLLAARLRLNQLPASRVYAGLALLLVLFLSACGGSSPRPAENLTVTVTATSGSLSHTVNFSLALH